MFSRLVVARHLANTTTNSSRGRVTSKRHYCVKKSDDTSSEKPSAFSAEGVEDKEPPKAESSFSSTKMDDAIPGNPKWRGASKPFSGVESFSDTGKAEKPKLSFSETTDDFDVAVPKKKKTTIRTAFSETKDLGEIKPAGGAFSQTAEPQGSPDFGGPKKGEARAMPGQQFWSADDAPPTQPDDDDSHHEQHPLGNTRAARLARRREKGKEKRDFDESPRGRAAKGRRKGTSGRDDGGGEVDWDDDDDNKHIDEVVERIAKERGVTITSTRKSAVQWEVGAPEDMERHTGQIEEETTTKRVELDLTDPDVKRKADAYMEHHGIDSTRDLDEDNKLDIDLWVKSERIADKPSKELMPLLFETMGKFQDMQKRKDKYFAKIDKDRKKYKASDKYKQKIAKVNANKKKFRERKRQWHEERKNDPNWMWHNDWSFWIHKDNLKNPVVYNAMTGMQNNCTMSPRQKAKTVVKIIRDLRWAENPPDWWMEEFGEIVDDLEEQKTIKTAGMEYKKRPESIRFPVIPFEDILTAAQAEIEEGDSLILLDDDRPRLGAL